MPSYAEYLKIDELLTLQQPLSDGPEHDEMLFIVIHQVYELWFKEVLHELDYLEQLLARKDEARAQHTMKRVLTILKVMVAQIDILETMTPLEFLSFRDRLESGSGFQSAQFRELEFRLGRKNAQGPGALRDRGARPGSGSSAGWRPQRSGTASCATSRPAALRSRGIELERDVTLPVEPNAEVRTALVAVYRNESGLAGLCERLVDLDEGLMEWRYRHVKMVQRTIGTKMGTGGSAGAEYLMTTLNSPLFPDLWAIRSEL